MTKEQINNLRVGDEIWLAKFKLGYDTTTNKAIALVNYQPKGFTILHYLCDNDFNIVGFYVKEVGTNFVHTIRTADIADGAISGNLKYATSKSEITEWYENHKREQKEALLKQFEDAINSIKDSRW